MPLSLGVDLLVLVAEHEWAQFDLGNSESHAYAWLADGPVTVDRVSTTWTATSFRLRGTLLRAVAARTPIGLMGSALVTRVLLEHYAPARVAQIGFGGLLSDDLRIGDVAVATQVDCYLTKNKAATARGRGAKRRLEITFAGEVFRTTVDYARTTIHLRYVFPDIAESLQAGIRASSHRAILRKHANVRKHLRNGPDGTASAVHLAHFASAELVSTSRKAVGWLRSRDRKAAVIDMESGGMLQAVEEYVARTGRPVESLVVRGVGGFADQRHEHLVGRHTEAFRGLGFEVAARFLASLCEAHLRSLPTDGNGAVIGIIIPMEEEFQYFHEMLAALGVDLAAGAIRQAGRYYYRFTRGGLSCVATFVGDMGLVRMALAAEDLRCAFSPTAVVVLGIAAGLAGGPARVGDVVVATAVDLYLDRGKLRISYSAAGATGESEARFADMSTQAVIPTTPALAAYILAPPPPGSARTNWSERCGDDLLANLQATGSDVHILDSAGIPRTPGVHGVRLASSELLSASAALVASLRERGCGAADMESGGALMACLGQTTDQTTKVLVLRGISDAGDEGKAKLERLASPNFLRRLCMRNATRLLLDLLEESEFAVCVQASVQPRSHSLA